ncbi:AAA family ATPase [Algiphilus sp.]|uniref:ExeA family protein n=1 Tax=Algiphilus sp. TaxID=1872431 RepID=UPI002A5E5362|nr:AAA family ATPase [Pseudomonadota bacterium]
MYTHFFRFSEAPFSITPDPAFLYLSPHHHEALAHLLYGTGEAGGFVQLTGEVGTGKTTVIRTLLEQKMPEVDVALILNPRQSTEEFLQSICDELGVAYPDDASLKQLVDHLNRHLLATHSQGRRTVLIIDEAQNLAEDVLEQVRLLTNLETSKEKLLRIMLIGQPELDDLLSRPSLRQLAQRITARFHLTALDRYETVEYIAHRLRVAGGDADIFTPSALRAAFNASQGIPRRINIICDRALLAAYSAGTRTVTAAMVRQAARETAPKRLQRARPLLRLGWIPGLAFAGMLAGAALMQLWSGRPSSPTPSTDAPPPPSAQERTPSPEATDALPALVWMPESAPTPTQAPGDAPSAPRQDSDLPPEAEGDSAASDPPALSAPALIQETPPLGTQVELLLGLWDSNLEIPAGTAVCNAVRRISLRCLRAEGNWDDLQRFDRPAILTLVAASGARSHVLVRGIDQTTARVVLDGALRPVERSLLDLLWNGEYLLFWRAEEGVDVLRPGDRGPQIEWLRRSMATLTGEPIIAPVSDRFDRALRDQVEAFQARHGLTVDGHVGERTHLMLMQQLQPDDGPRLLAGEG